jgi:hypothetical protein
LSRELNEARKEIKKLQESNKLGVVAEHATRQGIIAASTWTGSFTIAAWFNVFDSGGLTKHSFIVFVVFGVVSHFVAAVVWFLNRNV